MQLTFLKTKIHRATVTKADLNYEGSISIDQDLLDEAGIYVNEKVDVLNINNGERFTTYAISAPRGSGQIQINGAAARKSHEGDLVIIVAYVNIDEKEAKTFKPTVILVDKDNKVSKKI